MARTVLHLIREIEVPPVVPDIAGIALRNFAGRQDIEMWLELRRRAFGAETFRVRDWNRQDFAAEFLVKPWWSPDGFWFAENIASSVPLEHAIGSVALAVRAHPRKPTSESRGFHDIDALPVVHWLMVLPEWRRRGIGRLLVTTLEAACWQAGHRKVAVETHAAWSAAVAFYRSLGYR